MIDGQLQIRVLSRQDEAADAWDAYVRRHPQATSDHVSAWRSILSGVFAFQDYYLTSRFGDQIVGVLPLFSVSRGFRRAALSSIPFSSYGGVLADSPDVASMLIESAKSLAQENRAAYLELRDRDCVVLNGLSSQRQYVRFSLPLRTTSDMQQGDALGAASHAFLRTAEKQGLSVVASQDTQALHAIHVQETHSLGKACFPKRYFDAILKAFGAASCVYYVRLNEKTLAYALTIAFKETLNVQSMGILASARELYPEQLLSRALCSEAKSRGLREVDYGRSRRDSACAVVKRRLRVVERPMGCHYYVPRGGSMPAREITEKQPWFERAWQRLLPNV